MNTGGWNGKSGKNAVEKVRQGLAYRARIAFPAWCHRPGSSTEKNRNRAADAHERAKNSRITKSRIG